MSEMVDRVAESLAISADHNNWKEFIPDARAAILAMREPTHKMTEVFSASCNIPTDVIWEAMIDEALK